MSIFDNAETRFCKKLLALITENKPEPAAHVLCRCEAFSRDTAVLLSVYTFGYCMGSLDIELPKRYSSSICDRLSDRLTDLYLHYLNKDLMDPSVPANQRSSALSTVLAESNKHRSFVQHALLHEPNAFRLISTSYLETLQVSFFDLSAEEEADFISAVKYMLDFSVLPFPYPSL